MTKWIERWHGSGPDRGWWLWETEHGDPVAYVGEGDYSERLASIIVEKHNAAMAAPTPARTAAKAYLAALDDPRSGATATEERNAALRELRAAVKATSGDTF